MMELKEYQVRCLDNFDHWLKALEESKRASISGLKALTQQGVPERILDELRNYPKSAWESAPVKSILPQSAGVYIPRTDEAGQPIPHICFKVPTGGGKTLLAAAALDRLNRQTGLVLWIVPRNAIYEQTKNALWSREHPYRQMLERASDGRVKMLLKDDQNLAPRISTIISV